MLFQDGMVEEVVVAVVVADSCPPTILSYSPLLRASVTSEHCCMRVRHMMLWLISMGRDRENSTFFFVLLTFTIPTCSFCITVGCLRPS
jgi:hypothetical protein